ncbi:MAG: uncharacterized protein A8A55_3197 [Amphiamblys sp. WSBS2006]|nr:MAG: uncharacterized protein A8A55_3197 [Amphiamblys sp. WSBS2006]
MRVTVEENLFIAEYVDNEDCIREHGMARNRPLWLRRSRAVSPLVLENIERMAPNSIGCVLERVTLYKTGLINILPKLRIHEDSEIECLILSASEEAHVAAVLAQEKPFCVGRVKNMFLLGYAASVITKMTIHEDNTMKNFVLIGNEDQFSRILEEGDSSIDLGRIRTGGLCVPERIKRKLKYTLVY